MSRVRGKNTSAEIRVRSLAHRLGYRYRLHKKDLPGKPDLVFPRLRKVIFVNGCFWHGHQCARGARVPKGNREYWVDKVQRNVKRDATNKGALGALGWDVFTIWECETKDLAKLEEALTQFLGSRQSKD